MKRRIEIEGLNQSPHPIGVPVGGVIPRYRPGKTDQLRRIPGVNPEYDVPPGASDEEGFDVIGEILGAPLV